MTPDLDALDALLAEHRRDHNGNYCWCPCLEALPELIEAARREAAIRHWWETTHATELDRHDHHCPAERFRGPPPGHFENTGEPCTCGWTEASAALHDNAGVAARAALPAEGPGAER